MVSLTWVEIKGDVAMRSSVRRIVWVFFWKNILEIKCKIIKDER